MKIILQTERLYLREFIFSDGIQFFNLNSDFEVIKYTGNKPFISLYEANNFISTYNDYERNGFGRWAVCLKETHEFLGWCGLKKDEPSQEIDLGFRFFKRNWGKGYATEASLGCIFYGFGTLKISKIIGRVYKDNLASIHVLKKCKFKIVNFFEYDNQPAILFELKNDKNKEN